LKTKCPEAPTLTVGPLQALLPGRDGANLSKQPEGNSGEQIADSIRMSSEVREEPVHEVLKQHHVWYEVNPYYVSFGQRLQAGFDVDLYGTLEKDQLPLYRSEGARAVVNYFETVAQEIRLEVGQRCTIEVIPYTDSVVLDTQHHFQREVMLRIRISHDRGLDQPAGPPEEKAQAAILEKLHELGVKQG
jgi:hypothetical protein